MVYLPIKFTSLAIFLGLTLDIGTEGNTVLSQFFPKYAGEIIGSIGTQEFDQPLWYIGSKLSRRKRFVASEEQDGMNSKRNVRVKRYIGNYGKKKPPLLDKKCCLNAYFCVPWACMPTAITWKKVPEEVKNRYPRPGCICNDPYFCPPGCAYDPSVVDNSAGVLYPPKTKKPWTNEKQHR